MPLLGLFLSGCSTIPDTIICAEISLSKGICRYTISDKTITIDDNNLYEDETWFSMRNKALMVPAKSWAEIKSWMIKQCKKTNQCNVQIDSWDRDLGL
jgi:hypothetical protein